MFFVLSKHQHIIGVNDNGQPYAINVVSEIPSSPAIRKLCKRHVGEGDEERKRLWGTLGDSSVEIDGSRRGAVQSKFDRALLKHAGDKSCKLVASALAL